MRIAHEQCMYSLLVHLRVCGHMCAISHFNTMECFDSYTGAMNGPVMADTLPPTTECSHWIVTMSVMSMPACIAQTDMDVHCFVILTKG